jgi:hypothetical protein
MSRWLDNDERAAERFVNRDCCSHASVVAPDLQIGYYPEPELAVGSLLQSRALIKCWNIADRLRVGRSSEVKSGERVVLGWSIDHEHRASI